MKKYIYGQFKDGTPYVLENRYYMEREKKAREVLRTIALALLAFDVIGLIIIKVGIR
jgi:hypothetical protein